MARGDQATTSIALHKHPEKYKQVGGEGEGKWAWCLVALHLPWVQISNNQAYNRKCSIKFSKNELPIHIFHSNTWCTYPQNMSTKWKLKHNTNFSLKFGQIKNSYNFPLSSQILVKFKIPVIFWQHPGTYWLYIWWFQNFFFSQNLVTLGH
jgi:hypothetical protein